MYSHRENSSKTLKINFKLLSSDRSKNCNAPDLLNFYTDIATYCDLFEITNYQFVNFEIYRILIHNKEGIQISIHSRDPFEGGSTQLYSRTIT